MCKERREASLLWCADEQFYFTLVVSIGKKNEYGATVLMDTGPTEQLAQHARALHSAFPVVIDVHGSKEVTF